MASDLMMPEDRVRLAAAHFMSGDRRVYCLGCGGLREPDEPPCTCRLVDQHQSDVETSVDDAA